jgi:hypothetical protein
MAILGTRRMHLMDQELLTLPEHLSSPPVFSRVRVTLYLALCVCWVDRCLSFCHFSFGHCVVCSSIYGFWLLPWYTRHKNRTKKTKRWATRTPPKTGSEFRCSGRVSNSCLLQDTLHVPHIAETWLFRNGQPDRDDDVYFLQRWLQFRINVALFE